jgi:hypothetical protein
MPQAVIRGQYTYLLSYSITDAQYSWINFGLRHIVDSQIQYSRGRERSLSDTGVAVKNVNR